MTNAAITIQNETTNNLSLDIKLNEDDSIRELLLPLGDVRGGDSIEVGDRTTLDELNRNPQMRALLDATPPKVSINVVAGTRDVPGSDAASAAASSLGLGGLEVGNFRSTPADTDDHLLVPAMPFSAAILDVQVEVDTAEATVWALYDAAAGGGNRLSDDLSVAATARVRDAGSDLVGVVPTIAKGDPLYLNKGAAATATGNVIVTFQRL